MAFFATYKELRDAGTKAGPRVLARATESQRGKTVFLSHSSKDSELLPGAVAFLEEYGGAVYVDRNDPRLPKKTDQRTADIIRNTIGSCSRFVVFVTPNSKDSRWIPWELGIADGKKASSSVALFPAAPSKTEQDWASQEYLGLYRRIEFGKLKGHEGFLWLVRNHVENTATTLADWLLHS